MGTIQGRVPMTVETPLVSMSFEGGLEAYVSGGGQLLLWRPLVVDPATNVVLRIGPAAGGALVHPDQAPLLATLPGANATSVELREQGDGIRIVGWITIEPPPPSGTSGPN
jgi:hypothetical protein